MKGKWGRYLPSYIVGCLTLILIGCLVLLAGILLSSNQTISKIPFSTPVPTIAILESTEPSISHATVTTLPVTVTASINQPNSSSTQPNQLSLPLIIAKPENNSSQLANPTTSAIVFPPLFQLYPCLPQNPIQTAQVVHVVDGDTIRVSFGGQETPLRYIGIDAPENTKIVEAFGQQAFERNQQLLQGKSVFLIKDTSETDRYQRLLRYVFVGEEFINLILVKEGYARAERYPPDTACNNLFQQAQTEAQKNHLGIWGITTPPTSNQTNQQPTPTQCDPAYPTVCIPPPPPDLDCKDISYRNFKVLPPDPHYFDGDKNGIGCEKK
ncbi:MAG: thermonuclease family protein [Anaerolineales bacterium]